jgi:hypothetical protein
VGQVARNPVSVKAALRRVKPRWLLYLIGQQIKVNRRSAERSRRSQAAKNAKEGNTIAIFLTAVAFLAISPH